MGKRLLSFASLSVLFACALVVASNVACAAGKDKGAKALMAVDSDWSKAAVARNVDAVASFYAEDGVAYPPNEPIAIGRAAARKVWAAYFADPTFQISWKTTSAEVTNRTGWTVGTYQDSYKSSDGRTIMENGKYVTVWRKGADGTWKAIHDIWNGDTK